MQFCFPKIQNVLSLVILSFLIVSCNQNEPALKIDSVTDKLYEIDSTIQPDSVINGIITPYKNAIEAKMNKVIGTSETIMTTGFPEGLLSNFVCDLLFEYCNNTIAEPIDFCFTNNTGLRNIIPKGKVTVGNIYEIMPFDNEVVILEMDYAHLSQLFDFIGSNGKMCVSGIGLRFNKHGEIIKATIGDNPVDSSKIYKVATNDYIANGGNNMEFLYNIPKTQTGVLFREMIIDYISMQTEKGCILTSKIDGRITIE